MKKVLGIALIIGGAFAIKHFYDQFNSKIEMKLPELDFIEDKPVMSKEAQEKLYWELRSINENRFYINPSDIANDPDFIKKMNEIIPTRIDANGNRVYDITQSMDFSAMNVFNSPPPTQAEIDQMLAIDPDEFMKALEEFYKSN